MVISQKTWNKYIEKLAQVNKEATDKVRKYIDTFGIPDTHQEREDMIDYAYSISTVYGEAAAALSCEMFDAVALASGKFVVAEPAEVATMSEVGETVNGVLKRSQDSEVLSSAVGSLAKRAGCDTTLKNAEKYGAQFAWIPAGVTCAYCLMIASNGWRYMSKSAMKNGHAEHIHANCDCTYAVRFDEDTKYRGYNPDKLYSEWKSAKGSTEEDKLNYMRRKYYEENRETILKQKSDWYEKSKELNSSRAEETRT